MMISDGHPIAWKGQYASRAGQKDMLENHVDFQFQKSSQMYPWTRDALLPYVALPKLSQLSYAMPGPLHITNKHEHGAG